MRNPSSSSSTTKAGGASGSNKTTPCCAKVGLKRGPWTPEEDQLLAKYIEKEGEGRWRTLPKRAGLLRCGKSCRLRWMNYLRPSVKRGHIAPDEEDLILRLHRLLGNRWSLIAGRIPGRTDNEIKNYWNTHLSKKLISQGIDPRTHKPLNLSPNPNNPDPKPNPPPKPTPPNPVITTEESSLPQNPYLPPAPQSHQLDPYQSSPIGLVNSSGGYGNLTVTPAATDSDNASAIPFASNENNNTNVLPSEEVDGDINYCSDDVFSSFLNSLINDDPFSAQQLQQASNETNSIPLRLPCFPHNDLKTTLVHHVP